LNETEAFSVLSTISGLGNKRICRLVAHFGSALAVLAADAAAIAEIPGCNKLGTAICSWRSQDAWKQNLDLANKYGATLIPYTSPDYPKSLLKIEDYPVILYVKGQLEPTDQYSLAVIGTRQASIYGMEMATKISYELAGMGFPIVSGLARGIDTSAHKGSLGVKTGRTIAFIGSGLADIYPRENIPLAGQISHSGAVISEFPMNTPPDPQNFPQRNRLIAGLSQGVVLIEAPLEKSGAMLTMALAQMQGKPRFALPGRVDDANFSGNHHLIRQGVQLITNAREIADNFDNLFLPQSCSITPILAKKSAIPLGAEEEQFLQQLTQEEMTVDAIVGRTKIPVMKVNVLLMSLVLKKVVKEFPGKIYKKMI
jgi:DNA processing protein